MAKKITVTEEWLDGRLTVSMYAHAAAALERFAEVLVGKAGGAFGRGKDEEARTIRDCARLAGEEVRRLRDAHRACQKELDALEAHEKKERA